MMHRKEHSIIKSPKGKTSGFIQPKLVVGQHHDQFEQEADRVAEQVVQSSQELFFKPAIRPISAIQRKCAACEKEEEEKNIQRKENGVALREAPAIVDRVVQTNGSPLDKETQSFMESRLGYDFSHVRIHNDGVAAKSASSINALAYTSGNNIVFNQGQYNSRTDAGKKLLAHELTHVVQQTGMIQRAPCNTEVPDVKNPKDLGPAYNKTLNDIPEEDKVQQGKIRKSEQGSFFLYNIHNNPGCDSVESLVEGSEFYLISKGTYYSQVWVKQASMPEGIFVWGYVDNRFLDFAPEKKEEQQPTAAPDPFHLDTDKELPGSIEELNAYRDTEIESVIFDLSAGEILSITIEADLKSLGSVKAAADRVIEYKIDDEGLTSVYAELLGIAFNEEWDRAATQLEMLNVSQIALLASQLSSSQRESIRNASLNATVIEGIESIEHLKIEIDADVKQEAEAKTYRDNFGKDWDKAATALDTFDTEAIYIELQSVNDNENLRKLRKAADQVRAIKVSMVISTIIAHQDKTEAYLDTLNGNWSVNFGLGLADGGLDIALGDAWDSFMKDVSSSEGSAWFQLGFNAGLVVGVGKDLYNNVEGLVVILAKLVEYDVRLQYEPMVVLKEVGVMLKGLFESLKNAADAREFGYAIGRSLSAKLSTDFTSATPFYKGEEIGELVGMLATEIALLFVGVGEVTAAIKAIRATKLVVEIESILQKSEMLGRIIKGVQELKLGKLAEVAGLATKEAEALKIGSKIEDVAKAEEVLVDLAKLEARDGALITKQMEPLEEAILKEKVKTPENIQKVGPEFQSDYVAEVSVGDHKYRMKTDGTWCRFSFRKCGYKLADEINEAVKTVFHDDPILDSIHETTKGKALGKKQSINTERGITVHQFLEALEDWLAKEGKIEELSAANKKLIRQGSVPRESVAEFTVEASNGKRYRMDRVCFECDPPKIIEIKSDAPGEAEKGLTKLEGIYKPLMDNQFKGGLPNGKSLPPGGFAVEVVIYDRKLAEKILYGL